MYLSTCKEHILTILYTYISITGFLSSIQLAVALHTHSLRPGVAKMAQGYLVLGALVTENMATCPTTIDKLEIVRSKIK